MIKAVVFDLDDTLFLEIEYIKTGFNCVEKYLRSNYDAKVIDGFLLELFLNNKSNVYGRALEILNISYTQNDIDMLIDIYRNHIPKGIKLVDGALEILNWLNCKGYKIGMITDGRPIGQNNKIDCLGIREIFDKIIITDDLGVEYRKPNVKPFVLMSEALGVKYEEMLYIGDNCSKDFAVMKELPIYTIQILHSGRIYESSSYLYGIKPTKSIISFKQLIETIGEL